MRREGTKWLRCDVRYGSSTICPLMHKGGAEREPEGFIDVKRQQCAPMCNEGSAEREHVPPTSMPCHAMGWNCYRSIAIHPASLSLGCSLRAKHALTCAQHAYTAVIGLLLSSPSAIKTRQVASHEQARRWGTVHWGLTGTNRNYKK